MGKQWKQCQTLFFGAPKSLQMVTAAMKLEDAYSLDSVSKESACNVGDLGSIWVGKIPWRRAWQPIPVFLPGESPWIEEPGGLQSMGSQRV